MKICSSCQKEGDKEEFITIVPGGKVLCYICWRGQKSSRIGDKGVI